MEKKLNGNYTRMLQAILNKSWRQHLTKQQLYGHQPPIMKTIKIRQTRHVGHCWRSKDELINDVFMWTPSHRWAKLGWPARTYIQQLCANTGCSPENLLEAMDDREGWQEMVRDIHADGMTWWYQPMQVIYSESHPCKIIVVALSNPYMGGIRRFIHFPKVNILMQPKFKISYYDVAVHHFNNYTKRLPPRWNE